VWEQEKPVGTHSARDWGALLRQQGGQRACRGCSIVNQPGTTRMDGDGLRGTPPLTKPALQHPPGAGTHQQAAGELQVAQLQQLLACAPLLHAQQQRATKAPTAGRAGQAGCAAAQAAHHPPPPARQVTCQSVGPSPRVCVCGRVYACTHAWACMCVCVRVCALMLHGGLMPDHQLPGVRSFSCGQRSSMQEEAGLKSGACAPAPACRHLEHTCTTWEAGRTSPQGG